MEIANGYNDRVFHGEIWLEKDVRGSNSFR